MLVDDSVNPCDFFFNDTATTEIYTLSLHDALPISAAPSPEHVRAGARLRARHRGQGDRQSHRRDRERGANARRSEEHTSELQSRQYLVCRLLLEKKTTQHWMKPPSSTSLHGFICQM